MTAPPAGPASAQRLWDVYAEVMSQVGRAVPVLAAALEALAACARHVGAPAAPPASSVDRIHVSYGPPQGVAGTKTERTITDRATIDGFVGFVQARRSGWNEPWDTYPSPRGQVECRDGDRVLYSAWLGPDWIGGWEGAPGGPKGVRRLSAQEAVELRGMLGIPAD